MDRVLRRGSERPDRNQDSRGSITTIDLSQRRRYISRDMTQVDHRGERAKDRDEGSRWSVSISTMFEDAELAAIDKYDGSGLTTMVIW